MSPRNARASQEQRAVKSTWVTRHVPLDAVTWDRPLVPAVGDLLLCEVRRLGVHGRVETASGNRERLYVGDHIVCAVANRYATSLLEAVGQVRGAEADMVSASGLCGTVVTRNKKATSLTELTIVDQAFIGGQALNLRDCIVPPAQQPAVTPNSVEPEWVVVVGSAMDSGKTTACASIIHGLALDGHRVGAGKVTGTASARDLGAFRDAGASPVVDFLDFGWPSTAGCTELELAQILDGIVGSLRDADVDWGVIEIADGLLQGDTRFLLGMLAARLGHPRVVLTVREALSAVAGVELLTRAGLDTIAVSGLITNSPLACREVEETTRATCTPTHELGRRLAQSSRIMAAAATSFGADLEADRT